MDFKDDNLCVRIYEQMNLGTKKADMSAARDWLKNHQQLHCWIDGKYLLPQDETNYSKTILGDVACLIADGHYGIQTAFASSVEAQVQWNKLKPQVRLGVLNKITRSLSSSQIKKLFINIYDLQSQKNDFDLFLDYFVFYSSLSNNETWNGMTSGVVLAILSDTAPVWFLAMVSAAALWAGCSVIIKPPEKAPIFPFILAEICLEAGLPKGLINVVPGSSDVGEILCTLKFDKIVFGGNYSEGSSIGNRVPLNKFSPIVFNHTSFMLFDSCDLDGAIDKLFSENWECSQQGTWKVDLIVIQESICGIFIDKLASKMRKIKSNDCEFKFEDNTKLNLPKLLNISETFGVDLYVAKNDSGSDQILITEYDLEIRKPDDPITTLLIFKTAKNAVDIVNNHPYRTGISIWTENLAEAMEVSSELETCTIWINCHGVMDASVPMEVFRRSGTGVFGGLDGGLTFRSHQMNSWSPSQLVDSPNGHSIELEEIARKSKNSFMKWKSDKNRKEYLMKVCEEIKTKIESTSDDYLSHIVKFWAINGNTYEITMRPGRNNLYASQSKKPIGVIEMVLNDDQENVKTFVSWVTPAIIMGNVVIVVTSEKISNGLKSVINIFDENLPNGVVSVVKGLNHACQLAKDPCIQTVWMKNLDGSVQNDVILSGEFKCFWSPPSPIPECPAFLAKHVLKNQVIWFPTINSI